MSDAIVKVLGDGQRRDPAQYLSSKLDPISCELDQLGARHLVVAYMPDQRCLHFSTNAATHEAQIKIMEEAADRLRETVAKLRTGQAVYIPSPAGILTAQPR